MTDKEKHDILSDIVIIVDTREKKNLHILEFLDTNKIKYKVEKLDSGDYSFELPHYKHLGLDKSVLIERKNSLSELAGNFTKNRERFVNEFERIGDAKIHLIVETATWRKLLNGTYQSQFNPKSYMASLLTWNIRYNCPIWFAETKESPMIMYSIIHYELVEKLKGMK